MTDWKSGGEAYLPTLSATEQTCGIPAALLARIAFQECSWRQEVIDGTVKSPAGAVGMFQLMPKFFPHAGISWMADADTAAKYLVALHGQFDDDWTLAVAAYDWGPGDLQKWIEAGSNHEQLPNETVAYISDVFADVPVEGILLDDMKHPSPPQATLSQIQTELESLTRSLATMSAQVDANFLALQAQVTQNTTVEGSAVTLLQGLAAQLAAAIAAGANGDSAALPALQASLASSATALAAAITANTPSSTPAANATANAAVKGA